MTSCAKWSTAASAAAISTSGARDKTGVKTTTRSVVAGHEIVSIVKAVGKNVTTVKPGDRVVHEIVTMYCGRCPACLEGRFNICNTLPPMEGRAHFVTGGGFAKYTVWPEWQLHVLPDAISPKAAVLLEPVAGSVHTIITRMGVKAGESVAILGPGARGILLAQVCSTVKGYRNEHDRHAFTRHTDSKNDQGPAGLRTAAGRRC